MLIFSFKKNIYLHFIFQISDSMNDVGKVTMSQAPPSQRQRLASPSVPPVHGRPVPPVCVRTRLSNHQRNLSLDFR